MIYKVGDKVLVQGEVINASQFGECRVSISGCTENDTIYMWFNDDAIINNTVIEDNMDDIKVGDIVRSKVTGELAVITYIYTHGLMNIMFDDGAAIANININNYNFEKTGKHIDIISFLKQISE